jgi:ribonuclease R
MRDRIGDEHWGTVVGLTRFGIYVSIDDPFVEGLVRFDSLAEWMEFDPERMKIYGGDSGRVVSLGDHLRVRVVDASPARRQIDLELLEWGESLVPAPNWQPPPRARRSRGRERHPRRRKRR